MALDRISGHVLDGTALKRLGKIRKEFILVTPKLTQSDRVMEALGLVRIESHPISRRPGDAPVTRFYIGTTAKGDGQ